MSEAAEVIYGETELSGTNPLDRSIFDVNVGCEKVIENVRCNIARPLPQFQPIPERPMGQAEVALVHGGWSLEETMDELWELVHRGVPVIASNGAAAYLYEQNIRPDGHILLDAQEANVRFVEKAIPDCVYYLASQCHPKVFDACEGRDIHIWHCGCFFKEGEKEILDDYYKKKYQIVPGGSTVGIRSIGLAWLRGFRLIHIFGMDSCYAEDGRHHSFVQPQNDREQINAVLGVLSSGGEQEAAISFRCSGWQASQAEQFVDFVKNCGDAFHLNMHGSGLLAAIVNTGAELTLQSLKEG